MESFQPQPDGNTVKIQFIRPDSDESWPASTTSTAAAWPMSCFDGMYRAWGKIIAANGVAVAMVDFRNCLRASSVPEVAPSRPGSTTACPA